MKGLFSKLKKGLKKNLKKSALYAASAALPLAFIVGCDGGPPTTAPVLDITRILVRSSPGYWTTSHQALDWVLCGNGGPGIKPDYAKVNATGFNFDIYFEDSNNTWLKVDGAPFTLRSEHNNSVLGINPLPGGYWGAANCANTNLLHGASTLDGYGNSAAIFTNAIGDWPIGGVCSYGFKFDLIGTEGDSLPPSITEMDRKFTVSCPASSGNLAVVSTYHFRKTLQDTHFWDPLHVPAEGWVFKCGTQFDNPLGASWDMGMSDFEDVSDEEMGKQVNYESLESAKSDDAMIGNSSVGALEDVVVSRPVYKRYATGTGLDVDANDFQADHEYEEEIAYKITEANDIFIYRGFRWGFEIQKPEELIGVNVLDDKFTKYGQSAMINVINVDGSKTPYKTYVYPYKDNGDSFLAVSEEILQVWNQDLSGHYINENPVEGYEDLFYARKLVVPVEKQAVTTCPLPIEYNTITLKEVGEFAEVYVNEKRYDWVWDRDFDGDVDLEDFSLMADKFGK